MDEMNDLLITQRAHNERYAALLDAKRRFVIPPLNRRERMRRAVRDRWLDVRQRVGDFIAPG